MKKSKEEQEDFVKKKLADDDIECIDAIRAALGVGFKEYLQGNILKYIWRHKYKNGVEDLNKARWYLDRLIEAEITDGD